MKRLLCLILTAATLICLLPGCAERVKEPVTFYYLRENPSRGLGPEIAGEIREGSGVLLSVTFEKYSDGKVYVAGIDAIPTWVNMHSKNGKREYNILPLVKDKEEQWKTDFELTDNELTAAQDSYAKTMKIIGGSNRTSHRNRRWASAAQPAGFPAWWCRSGAFPPE